MIACVAVELLSYVYVFRSLTTSKRNGSMLGFESSKPLKSGQSGVDSTCHFVAIWKMHARRDMIGHHTQHWSWLSMSSRRHKSLRAIHFDLAECKCNLKRSDSTWTHHFPSHNSQLAIWQGVIPVACSPFLILDHVRDNLLHHASARE